MNSFFPRLVGLFDTEARVSRRLVHASCHLLFAWLIVSPDLQAQKSPEILPDGRVTFRFRSSEAKEVLAKGQFGKDLSLSKGEKGLWSGTTIDPVPAGIHEYRFVVDKLSVLDSRNSAVKPQRWPGTSMLHIPNEPLALWDLQSVPHGSLHHHGYVSKALDGAWRELVVYSPPNAKGPLPVLYLAHGYSDEEKTWTVHGKAHWILDALIAQKKAVPMLIVMSNAHAIDPEGAAWGEYAPANSNAFCRELIEDVIPLIERHYSVGKDASSRAFAGLSMGGHHALTVALQYSGQFSQIGAFSSATPPSEWVAEALKSTPQLNRQLQLLWVACGDKDFLFKRNEEVHAAFMKSGLEHEYVVTKGDDHSWPVWRRYLADFAPRLFQ
jgi:enterochelin esterase family protein